MSEENCCILGKVPKVLSYVRGSDYVRTVCKLKDEVDCFVLTEFFNMVYRVKLEIWDENFFTKNYNTGDLIKCFHLILEENCFINLKDLCRFVGNFKELNNHPILRVVKCFFEMFDVIEVEHFSLENISDIKFMAVNSNDNFYKEVESIFYNSKVMNSLDGKKKIKIKKQSFIS